MSDLAAAGADGRPHAEDVARIVLRPLASPLPLGFLALAVGSFLFGALQLHWVPVGDTPQVAFIVLAFVAPIELLTAVIAFFIRDVVMATGLGLLAGSWAAVGWLLATGTPGRTSPVLGLFAVAVAVALLVPSAAAAWSKPVATVLMTVAAVRFALTGVYELTGASPWQTATAIIGLVLCASSLYGSLALELEDARHRSILPISRYTTSRAAMSGHLPDQLADLAHEAGVRQES
jgi:uncharacterized protein